MLTDKEARHGEAGERQIDRFIEQRSRQFGAEEASEFARQQAQAEREEEADRAALRRFLWAKHHRRLADVHASLAAEHEQRAQQLAGAAG